MENTPHGQKVMSCIPQDTVLGPLRFLTYINDLPNNIHSSIRLFADHCVGLLYREIKMKLIHKNCKPLELTDEMGV